MGSFVHPWVDVTESPQPYDRQVEPLGRFGWRDAWLPAFLWAVGAIELLVLRVDGWSAGVALEAVAVAVLVFRRSWALVAVPTSMVVLLLMPLFGVDMDEPATPIAVIVLGLYSLGRYAPRLGGVLCAVITVTLAVVDLTVRDDGNWSDVMFVLSLAVPPFVLGRITRRLADQTAALTAAQEQIREQAVRAERDRIARELHDVIAHSVSAMVVQTAAAQDLLRTDPARVERVLADVADTGRQALAETGRLLHVIRDVDDELGLAPAPGLADVPALVERFRTGGLVVTLDLSEPVPAVPSGVDVSAYRIVQETLTNAMRYSADRTAAVSVEATKEAVTIHTVNPMNGRTGDGSGLGLLGLAERVALLGGTLDHGTGPDGRFRVDAVLPVPR